VVTFSDNTSQEDFSEVEPYSFNYWEELNKRFSSAKPIRSVELRIIVDGKARGVFIDDCYLRRSDDAFMHMAPQVISASVAPQAIIAGEYVTLTAAVGADMPAGSKIIGQWSSNLEGQLGSPVEAVTAAFTGPQGRSRAVLTISQKLAQEGEHNLCFTARDSFGYDDLTVVKLLVLQPACVIAPAAGTSLIDSAGSLKPLSGVVRFKTNITGLGALGAAVTVEAKLLADNKTQGTVGSSSLWVEQSLDTAKVRNGIVDVQAVIRIKVQRAGSQVSFGPYYSNVLQVYINDPAKKNVLAVITASPLEGQSPFEVQFDGAYSFASQGKVITGYKWDFGDRSGSTQAAPSRVFSSNQAKPYTYTVKLTVKDSLPSEDTAEVPITVQPEALVRQFKCAYKAALAGEDVPLEAELSAFSGDTINIEISSDLEPGAAIRFQEKIPGAASGLFVAKRKITRTVRFSREGTHTLTLKAVNSYGSAAEMKTVVKVASLPQTVALIISNLPEQRGALCPAGTFKYGELVRFKVDNGILKTFLESGEYEISGGAIVFSEQSSPETAALTVPVTGLEFSVESYRITRLIPGDNIAVRAQVRGLVLQRKGASQGLAALNSSSADFRVTVNDCAGDPPLPPLPQGEELFELALGRDQTTLNSGYPTFPQDIVPGDNTPFTFSCIPKEENAELYQKFNNGELRYMGMDLMIISDYWPVQIIRNNMLAPVDHDPPYTEAEFEQSNRYRMRYIRPSRELWNFIAGMRSQNLTRCDLYLQCKVYLEDAAGRKWFALTDKKRFVIQKT
jgi:PKD repeat protein